ncbi:hypothetical protein I4U23_022285 [Adineta vaga]|nr:hypothetical protein I4U23_022285 [Adineta vaga]
MNIPTRMNTGTAQHFDNVGMRIYNYIRQNNAHQLRPAFGQAHQFQPIRGIAFASNILQYRGQQSGGYPAPNYSAVEFARRFASNLVHSKN